MAAHATVTAQNLRSPAAFQVRGRAPSVSPSVGEAIGPLCALRSFQLEHPRLLFLSVNSELVAADLPLIGAAFLNEFLHTSRYSQYWATKNSIEEGNPRHWIQFHTYHPQFPESNAIVSTSVATQVWSTFLTSDARSGVVPEGLEWRLTLTPQLQKSCFELKFRPLDGQIDVFLRHKLTAWPSEDEFLIQHQSHVCIGTHCSRKPAEGDRQSDKHRKSSRRRFSARFQFPNIDSGFFRPLFEELDGSEASTPASVCQIKIRSTTSGRILSRTWEQKDGETEWTPSKWSYKLEATDSQSDPMTVAFRGRDNQTETENRSSKTCKRGLSVGVEFPLHGERRRLCPIYPDQLEGWDPDRYSRVRLQSYLTPTDKSGSCMVFMYPHNRRETLQTSCEINEPIPEPVQECIFTWPDPHRWAMGYGDPSVLIQEFAPPLHQLLSLLGTEEEFIQYGGGGRLQV